MINFFSFLTAPLCCFRQGLQIQISNFRSLLYSEDTAHQLRFNWQSGGVTLTFLFSISFSFSSCFFASTRSLLRDFSSWLSLPPAWLTLLIFLEVGSLIEMTLCSCSCFSCWTCSCLTGQHYNT